jgi:hypothetical protein
MLEACWCAAMERAEWQLPTFAKVSQNMATMATLLDTLPAPSTNRVSEVYQRLKSILDTTAVQQAERSLQHRVEASILPPTHPKDEGQRATQGDFGPGNDFRTSKIFSLRPFKPTMRSVRTSGILMAPPSAC